MTVWFDMDGTFVNLYGVDNWLNYLLNSDSTPYKIAKPLFNMNSFSKLLHKLQRNNIKIGIISWTSKNCSEKYFQKIFIEKNRWLKTHLSSVNFDYIYILEYGTPKYTVAQKDDILFDDEINNRKTWRGTAYDENNILKQLRKIVNG